MSNRISWKGGLSSLLVAYLDQLYEWFSTHNVCEQSLNLTKNHQGEIITKKKRRSIAVKWLLKASLMPKGSLRLSSVGTGVTEMLILVRKKDLKKMEN